MMWYAMLFTELVYIYWLFFILHSILPDSSHCIYPKVVQSYVSPDLYIYGRSCLNHASKLRFSSN